MPKSSLHAITWSEEQKRYELRTQGELQQYFGSENNQPWQDWLIEQTSFAFQGRLGHMSVVKEARARGNGYWYAYSTLQGQTRKRYLGQTSGATLERLEQVAQAFANEHRSVSQTGQQITQASSDSLNLAHQSHIPLIATKHTHPQLPSILVRRERLLQEMDKVLTHRLLLLSSSAGSGKTTLLSTWASRSPHIVGWLSLDEADNDPTRFWASVITTLRICLPEISDIALAMLYTPQPPPLSTILITFINEILRSSNEIILILDDYHVIEDQAIHEAMLFLLDHLPANMHLVIASRVDPPLPLARWRMRGQMSEIREPEVRFTPVEAQAFLNEGMTLSLSETEVQVLEKRTEGWIAGLQLAALSLRSHKKPSTFIEHFTGEYRFIFDYVQEEILQHQAPSVQQFLLQVAVLSRMNAALCQELTGEPASQELLEMLERHNLFIVPLDEQRQWYRLHTLFREVLLARLQATQPEQVNTLHQRAARWHAAQGSIHEAMSHALAAQDYPFAATTLKQSARQLWTQGEARTIATWLLQLPENILLEHLGFALTSALNLLSSTQYMPEQQRVQALSQSEQIIARVEQILSSERTTSLAPTDVEKIENRICLLREFILMSEAFRKGNMQQLRLIAQRIQPLTVSESVAWKWLALHGLFVSSQVVGDSVLLLPELLALKQQALQEQDHAIAIVVTCWLAAAFLYAGQLHSLHQECLQAQDLLAQLGQNVSVTAYPAFDLSFLYYARNKLEQAEGSLQVALQHAARWQDMNLLIWGHATYVKIALASGKIADAEEALEQAQNLIQSTGFTNYAHDVSAAQVALWLAQGNFTAAEDWAARYDFNPQTLSFLYIEEYIALVNIHLAQQEYAQALHILIPLLSRMEQCKRTWDIIHLLALQANALYGLREMEQAQQIVIRLLNLTEPEGYMRVYLDAGKPMRQLLQNLLKNPPGQELSSACVSYISTLLTAFVQEEQKRTQQAAILPSEGHTTQAPEGLYEPLSPQEQRVLSLLVAGQTYAEIAQKLIVSPNTIKTQVSSIYRKLDVSRRAEAIAVARRLHLL
ncbi:LuxR family transcriptional regulator [Ktedonobacter sp. SOSP1-85]|uniref:LuxR C-terminal-related transcriptional regulator n=1 Tax=Ktedonobacter sp. SOSP1-85 TaxID=2778367 RepID=UPI001914E57D|nr:LuxR C-terminal-related transcriptional regulator [Ktedonobacter sp. SOSP1-85]GHO78946.1 LuxR family transcriptional regulator [Ktedonobacter sp. SOSP1-85]